MGVDQCFQKATDPAALKAALMSSSHIVYDITSHISQVEAASWAVQGIQLHIIVCSLFFISMHILSTMHSMD